MYNQTPNSFIEILKQNRRLLLLAGPLALTLLVVILAITFLQPSPQQLNTQRQNQGTTSTATPLNPTLQAKKLNVAFVSPSNTATGISLFQPISVTFTKNIPKNEQSTMQITTSPYVAGAVTWSSDNKTLTFTPQDSFASQSKYIVTLTSAQEPFSWSFQTVSNAAISEDEVTRVERESAEFTKKQDAEFDRNYPWWESFPLQKENYFVFFDANKKTFVGLLYPQRSDPTPIDTQTASMKTEILTSIRNLGINVEQYGIEWKITPE